VDWRIPSELQNWWLTFFDFSNLTKELISLRLLYLNIYGFDIDNYTLNELKILEKLHEKIEKEKEEKRLEYEKSNKDRFSFDKFKSKN